MRGFYIFRIIDSGENMQWSVSLCTRLYQFYWKADPICTYTLWNQVSLEGSFQIDSSEKSNCIHSGFKIDMKRHLGSFARFYKTSFGSIITILRYDVLRISVYGYGYIVNSYSCGKDGNRLTGKRNILSLLYLFKA